MAERHPTLVEDGDAVLILDQTRLPREAVMLRLVTLEDAAHAIRVMQVRGAPLIGATAAYGVALGLGRMTAAMRAWTTYLPRSGDPSDGGEPALGAGAHGARAAKVGAGDTARAGLATRRGRSPSRTRRANAAIGQHGLPLIAAIHAAFGTGRTIPCTPFPGKGATMARQAAPAIVNVMTHCNAGRLATVEHGTAISPIYAAHAAGLPVHVWVSETRPRNQGLLTAWELAEAGVPHTLIADNAAGLLMMQGKVDLVIVGADRIAANGDTANKVGTYLKALAAHAHGVPFYVAAPLSTIDFACSSGREDSDRGTRRRRTRRRSVRRSPIRLST
jgi:methylthioribose-1-phosphate isomerase